MQILRKELFSKAFKEGGKIFENLKIPNRNSIHWRKEGFKEFFFWAKTLEKCPSI
jgi:hypothetical protein